MYRLLLHDIALISSVSCLEMLSYFKRLFHGVNNDQLLLTIQTRFLTSPLQPLILSP